VLVADYKVLLFSLRPEIVGDSGSRWF